MPDDRLRDYTTTDLSTTDDVNGKNELLREMYAEVNSNYRNLAEIRFKLLGFVPAVSVIAWVELFDKISTDNSTGATLGLVITILALRIIFGIRVYDKRNDELYNDLVSRGRKIEDELQINTGIFKGRLKPNKTDPILKKEINHGRGLNLIYSSVMIGWVIFFVRYAHSFIYHLINS